MVSSTNVNSKVKTGCGKILSFRVAIHPSLPGINVCACCIGFIIDILLYLLLYFTIKCSDFDIKYFHDHYK